jgi:hypothetical protein
MLSLLWQDIPCWNDLLWVEPPELFFPLQANKQMPCSLELHNESDAHMAFFIKNGSDLLYHVDPEIGVIEPHSHLSVKITLLEMEEGPELMRNANAFSVKSIKVNAGLAAKDITKDFFSKKSGNIADKVRIGAIFDARERAKCCISEEELLLELSVCGLDRLLPDFYTTKLEVCETFFS